MQLADFFRDTGTSFAELRDSIGPPGQPSSLDTLLARAVERGGLADVPRPPRVVSLPFDLFRHEILMTTRPVPDDVVDQIVDDRWRPLLRLG